MKSEKVKVGIIGLGKMGLLHASILRTMPDVEVAALCEKNNMLVRVGKKVFREAKLVSDVSKLSGLDLDAVYVTTPIPTHFHICSTLYSDRIAHNVFCEKTLASNYDESKSLCRLSQNQGGTNMVGYMKRFAVTFAKAKELLSEGVIGEMISFRGYAFSSDFFGVRQPRRSAAPRGGVAKDLGAHVVDLALWYFGDLKVTSAIPKYLDSTGSGDSVHFTVKTARDKLGCFDVSWCLDGYRMPEFGLEIRGTKGILEVNDDEVKIMGKGESYGWRRHDLNENVPFLCGSPEYFREDEHFVRSVVDGTNATPDFATASEADRVLDQVNRRDCQR